jgi:UDP-glucuronate 4-epimerase
MMRADVSYTFANIDKAKRLLDYNPSVSVEEGVKHFYEWFKSAVGDPAA